MRILLTNNAMNHLYGTESWVLSVGKELLRRGHSVEVFTLHKGLASGLAERMGIPVKGPPDDVGEDFDLALMNHSSTWPYVPTYVKRIFTTHGVKSSLEEPPKTGIWKAVTVAVSEESARGIYQVIRGGIDLCRFRPVRPINPEPRTVLYLSHPHYAGGIKLVEEACRISGFRFICLKTETVVPEVLIQEADVVVGFGRSLIEAMGCGRVVVSGDNRTHYMDGFHGGGMVTPDNFDVLKRDSFTGRTSGQKNFTPETLTEEFRRYHPEYGQLLRERIYGEFNVSVMVDRYLQLAKEMG